MTTVRTTTEARYHGQVTAGHTQTIGWGADQHFGDLCCPSTCTRRHTMIAAPLLLLPCDRLDPTASSLVNAGRREEGGG
jgi:hypothetical protein